MPLTSCLAIYYTHGIFVLSQSKQSINKPFLGVNSRCLLRSAFYIRARYQWLTAPGAPREQDQRASEPRKLGNVPCQIRHGSQLSPKH